MPDAFEDSVAEAHDAGPDEVSVLVVMVAHDPGDWFDETLDSLARQDFENLRVAVVDAAGSGIGSRVRAVIDDAAVIKAPGASGFSAAANAVLATDLTASFFLVCHDDVSLASDAVTVLVTEALRSNAGVAGPKVLHWDRPDVIQHVGFDVDRFGVASGVAGVDEIDQEQHDTVRDAFAVSSAAMLIRGDLFARLGGFDPAMAFKGEEVDLCWRAQMAGARVVTAGNAAVRHRQKIADRAGADVARREGSRNSLRAMLVNHGRLSLMIFVPLALGLSSAEIAVSTVTARFGRVRAVIAAWAWNFARLGDVVVRRRANSAVRKVRQADVTALQHLGSVRVTSFMRRRFGDSQEGSAGIFSSAGRGVLETLRAGAARTAWVAWGLVAVAVLFACRALITGGVPAVGDFAPFPSTAGELLEDWWGGWSHRGTGAPSSNLGGLLWLGAAGWLFERVGGSLELVRTVWVIGPIGVGLIGSYRMLAAVGSRRAQVGALAGYLLVPLAPSSVAGGSAAGLVAYAAAPWMLAAGLRSLGAAPFGAKSGRRLRTLPRAALALGTAAGLAALFAPAAALLPALLAAGLTAGSLLVGRPGGILRLLTGSVLAVLVAALIAFPLVVDTAAAGPSWQMLADGRDGSPGSLSLAQLLRFAAGPEDPGLRVWLLAAPMLLPLLIGRGWRLEQSVRFWMVALTAWGLALAAQQGVLGIGLPDVHLLLAPAAAAVAALCGMAVLAVEHDLRSARFGWRHALVPITAAAAVLTAAAGVGLLEDGRLGLARSHHHSLLAFEPEVLSGSYRVVWIGAPEFLAVEGRSLGAGLAWAVTAGDQVTIADRLLPADAGRADLVAATLEELADGRTTRAGRRLAGLGVRYVAVLHRLAPAPFSSEAQALSPPADFMTALRSQLDLELLEGTNSAVDVFVNRSWVPMRALHAPGFDSGVSSIADLEVRPLGSGAAVLSGDGPPWSGSAPDGAEVFVGHTPRAGWRLSVDGVEAAPRRAVSWARAYQPGSGGEVVLEYSAPWWRRGGQVVGALAPLALAAGWLRRRIGKA